MTANQLRIEGDLHELLKTRADQLGVPAVWLARKLLAEGLNDMLPPEEIRFTRERVG